VPNVLVVPAGKLSHPMALVVLVVVGDGLVHGRREFNRQDAKEGSGVATKTHKDHKCEQLFLFTA